MNTYDIGDRVTLAGSFAASGVAADPTAIVFSYRPPSGTVVTKTYGVDAAVVRDDPGEYHIDIDPTEPGEWWFRYQGTGAVVTAAESSFTVRERRVG